LSPCVAVSAPNNYGSNVLVHGLPARYCDG
jgi:hypothetical protein